MGREFRYRWEWDLRSPPEAIWPFLADTNRFNRDTGIPEIRRVLSQVMNRRLAFSLFGMNIEWDEFPFEWVRPHGFSILRRYHTGPIEEVHAEAELKRTPAGGTHLVYAIRARARGLVGRLVIPFKVGFRTRRNFDRVFEGYDRLASEGRTFSDGSNPFVFAPAGAKRLASLSEELAVQGVARDLVEKLAGFLEHADDLTLARIRPYLIADRWKRPRREVLELCLRAVRVGLLDARWDVLCPLCRGAKKTGHGLAEIDESAHCDACEVDFVATFDRSIEVTFRPHPSVRPVESREYCIGGPQLTPHIVSQQSVPPGAERAVQTLLEPGAHRVRAPGIPGEATFRVALSGAADVSVRLEESGWKTDDVPVAPDAAVRLANRTATARLFIVERSEWSTLAATAAEVTTLQVFRDLFGREALRPDVRLGVESVTVLFTDLRGSTRLYREIGDAPAFGQVMKHFDVLRAEVDREGGSLVKTMGDAVMAVFRRPLGGVRAFLNANRKLAAPLVLKGGIHSGPALAVNQNDQLDYFGSTVNLASRLESLALGGDLVASEAVAGDPEVRELLAKTDVERFEAEVRSFEGRPFPLWRLR